METGKAIYKLLKDSSDVGAICADRIYPEMAQQDAALPFIVYTVTDTTPAATKNATSKLDTARVELYCVSDDYEQSMNLGIAVRGALDRQSGTLSGVQVQSIDFDTSDVQFDPDQRVYVLEQTYDVRIQRSGTAVAVATFPSNSFTVEEVDGSPSGEVNKLKVSNGALSIDGTTATITTGSASYYTLTSHFSNTDLSANLFVPFVGTSEAGTFGNEHMFVCPFNGTLKAIYLMRASGNNITTGSINLDFRRVTGSSSSSRVEEASIAAPINVLQVKNTSLTDAQVVAGNAFILNVRNTGDEVLGEVNLSLVFEVTSIA